MDILDRNYDLLYDYFCNTLDRYESFKIFKARRCQVLLGIFLPVIRKNEPDIQIRGTFISSNAIAKYKEQIASSSALILDDILIHGRGLQELYENLDEHYQNENIHIYVHKMDRAADAMTDHLKSKIEYDSKVFDWEWRELSTQLVNVIQATATPYVSYVGTYTSLQSIDSKRVEDRFVVLDNTNQDQEYVGTKALVLFERDSMPAIIQKGAYDACIRYYENSRIKKYVYAPYVFMKSLSGRDIHNFCSVFARQVGNQRHALRRELLSDQNNDLRLKYKACLVNAMLNRIYGLYLNYKYEGMFDFSSVDQPTLAMCFGNDVADDIEKIAYDDISGLMQMEFGVTECEKDLGESMALADGLEKALAEMNEDEDPLRIYFYFNRQMDEDSVKRKEKRKKGLSIKTFYDKIGGDTHQASAMQLKSWDAGIAACDLVVMDNNCVSSCVRAGEQSFRYIVDKMDKIGIDANLKKQNEDSEDGMEKLSCELLKQFLTANKEHLEEWRLPKIYLSNKG